MNTFSVMSVLSPHLPIYRVQITSFLSIAHRLTELAIYGVGLFFVLALWLVSTPWMEGVSAQVDPLWTIGMMTIINVILAYHVLGTLRYIFWDLGRGFEWVTLSGWGAILGSWAIALLPSWKFFAQIS